jgi:trans-2,3-dihydro-3-hydroxyanthranilate isomerase
VPGTFRYVLADVFTDTPLTGNGLAVFTDARDIPEEQLQPLARELNLSETVYVYPADEGGEAHVRVRIFTPGSELDFAGHPVLGTAFVLGGPLQLEEIRLLTGRGVVPVRLEREGARIVFGRMSQPLPSSQPYEHERELLEALGVERPELPVLVYDNGIRHAFVGLASVDDVTGLDPDMTALAKLTGYVGAVVFAGEGSRWRVRMFAPGDGITEDPATGSAAGPLGVHLARHGRIAWGDEIEIDQGVEMGRPSKLYARVEGEGETPTTVEVGGSAVLVARGEFRF